MEKKYQVFISSTYTDLIPEREKVRDVILSMYHFPIGMEMFSAANENQWEIIKETIDSSDYYVLIIGKRYGSVIETGLDKGISYTEKEYRYAKSIGLPILAYIKNEKAITADNVEDNVEKLKKLQNFKDDVTKGREVKWFSSIDQLGTEVTLSLHKEMKRKKRPGWIRDDSVDIEKSLSEIVELSRMNRELVEENKRLKIELEKLKTSSEHMPELTIGLGLSRLEKNEQHPDFYCRNELMKIDENGAIRLKLKALSTNIKKAEYHQLSKKDIPEKLQGYVTDQDIQNYNLELPSEKELAKYLEAYSIYLRLKENGVATTFYVNNIGSAKATDISVRIVFPEQIRVFDISEIEKMPEPQAPEKPENPIQKAYDNLHKGNPFSFDFDHPIRKGLQEIIAESNFSSLYSEIRNSSLFEMMEIENNVVEIEQRNGIVHTKSDWFPGAYVVPLIKGEFEAKASIMCAEYDRPREATIRIVVEE